jgi:sugar-specific transcriptional regulator TrmB
MENIAIKENCDFEARWLIENTGVKQRRIYDLMNILEGCRFIKRTTKGKYTWFGFEHTAI